jgi:outer membrane receptor protein involved in Fe transport
MHEGNDKIFFSFFRNTTNGQSADGRPIYSYTNPNGTMFAKIDYLHVFSPRLINEVGVSYVRNTGSQSDKIPSLPNVYYIGGFSDDFSQWGPSAWTQNNFIYQDSVTYIRGKHSFHAGIDIDRLQDLDDFTNGLVRPFFYFLSPMDFAIDKPFHQGGPVVDLSTQAVAHNLYQRIMMLYVAPYFQDDWKITPRLTLNLGVRLERAAIDCLLHPRRRCRFCDAGCQRQHANAWKQRCSNVGSAVSLYPAAGFCMGCFRYGQTLTAGRLWHLQQ